MTSIQKESNNQKGLHTEPTHFMVSKRFGTKIVVALNMGLMSRMMITLQKTRISSSQNKSSVRMYNLPLPVMTTVLCVGQWGFFS